MLRKQSCPICIFESIQFGDGSLAEFHFNEVFIAQLGGERLEILVPLRVSHSFNF